MTKMILLAVLLFKSVAAFAVINPYKDINVSFVKKAEFTLKVDRDIFYGHPKVGFFKANIKNFTKGKMLVQYIPPTYKFPTQFYIKHNSKFIKVHSEQNKSPLPPAFNLIKINVSGEFTDPYFLVGGSIPRSRFKEFENGRLSPDLPLKNKTRFSFPMIVNKLGEIVWIYVPVDNGDPAREYPVIEPVEKGKYGLLLGRTTSSFEVINWKGEQEEFFKTQEFSPAQPMHHDFVAYRKESFITFGLSAHQYGTNKKYVSSTIMRVLPQKKQVQVLKDFGLDFNPYKTDWEEEKDESETHFYHWDKPEADHDFLHANGLRTSKAGHLVSFRHLSKVMLLEKNTLNTIWTVGPSKDNTFVASGEGKFKFQHSPIMDEDGNLVLFDNNPDSRQSRVVALELKNGKAEMKWEFPKNSQFYSKDRGSVMMNTSKNAIALFVSPLVNQKPFPQNTRSDYIVEFDPKAGKELATMKITFFTKSPGYRAEPLTSIGTESYIKNLEKNL